MKRYLSLDDVRLFLLVVSAGSLSAAARQSDVSVPTLGRRMSELERALGEALFVRGARGYTLTGRGRAFFEEAQELAGLAGRLENFANPAAQVRVRITAGHWTSRFIATHVTRYWSPEAGWVPEFVDTNRPVDIARREADIGIRNRRPDQPWLAGRKTHTVQYAVYARAPEVRGFVARPEGESQSATERWLYQHHGQEIVTTATSMRLALDLALAGVGRILLPLFAGDGVSGLQRVGTPIEELTSEEWLVCHHEGRHDPPVRAALEAIATLLGDAELRPEV